MALDIITSDLVIDESLGTGSDAAKTDDDFSGAVPAALAALGTPLEVAFQANFLTVTSAANEAVTGVKLAAPGGGDIPVDGILTTLETIDGELITLFQGPGGVVEGRTADGDLAIAIQLVNNKDLYVAQYIALKHPDTTSPDDQLDLAGFISASVTSVQTNTFTGQNAPNGAGQYYLLSPAIGGSSQLLVTGFAPNKDGVIVNATPNVSDQGFGINNQSINPKEILQVDFVTGGTPGIGSGSQIAYGSHIDGITTAGFTVNQITPSAPDKRVDFTIQALDVTGNEQGSDYFDGSPTTARTIDSLTINQNGAIFVFTTNTTQGGITVSGLGTTTVTVLNVDNVAVVDFTTGAQFDRMLIKGIDANEGMDVTEVHFKKTIANAHNEDVGAAINFDDDGPKIDLTGKVAKLIVDESEIANIGSAPDADGAKAVQDFADAFTASYGADGSGGLTYKLEVTDGADSGLVDTASGKAVLLYKDATGGIVGKTSGGDVVFTLTLSGSSVTLEQLRAVRHTDTTDHDDQVTLLESDLVRLVATAKDSEGDEATTALGIGRHLFFEDDGPSIVVTSGKVQLETDESYLATGSAGADLTQTKVTASYAVLFQAAYGSDGAGKVTGFTLGIKEGVTDSGLTACINGADEKILLSKDGDGNIIGTSETSNTAVFKISVDGDGNVTLEQFAAIHHGNPGTTTDDAVSLADDLITLSAQASDKEGDLGDAATANIGGTFVFHDDVSTIGADDAATVSFTAGQSVKGSTGGVAGADTAKVALTSYADLAGFFAEKVGNTVTYYKGTDKTGEKWFQFTVDNDGNYTFDVLKTGLSEGEGVDFARIKGGKPVETLTVSTKFDHAQITFDGRIFTPGTNVKFFDQFVNSTTKNVDDINSDNLGFGIMGANANQASQINNNEAFVAKIGENADFFQFDIQGVGNNANGVHIDYALIKDNNNNGVYDDGDTLVQNVTDKRYDVKSGSATTTVKLDPAQDFDLVYMRFHFEADDLQNGVNLNKTQLKQAVDNAGIRLQNFAVKTIDTIPEYDFDFGMTRTDHDGDATRVMHTKIHVDPDVLPSVTPVNADFIL